MQKIAIIGAGDIGSAIGEVLEKNKNLEVSYWDKNRSKLKKETELSDIVSGADFLFLCVPSWAQRECLKNTKGILKNSAVVVSLAKGIESSGRTMDKVLKEELEDKNNFAILAGPMIAEEIKKGMPTFGVLASSEKDVFEAVSKLFENSNIKLEYNSDVFGVALCGVLKNIYSLAIGILDGMGAGENAKGYMFSKAVDEMADILNMLGQDKKTAFSVAGLGDLLATGLSKHSHNREAGAKIAKGKKDVKSEGIVSLPVVFEMIKKRANKLPVLSSIFGIIFKHDPCSLIFSHTNKF